MPKRTHLSPPPRKRKTTAEAKKEIDIALSLNPEAYGNYYL